jgi:putative glutamine amidotransferase
MKKVYVTCGGARDINWLGKDYKLSHNLKDADFVLFTGGADINPRLYKQNAIPQTHFSNERDTYELDVYFRARNQNIPMIGICRGAQFLCAMNGGELWQDVNHPMSHVMNTKYDTKLICNSYHHQMLNLSKLVEGVDYDLIAWSNNLSPRKEDARGQIYTDEDYREPEAVHFLKSNTFVVQYHPEFEPTSEHAHFAREEFERIYAPILAH